MEICYHLRQNGFNIPEDVSGICFNNPLSAFSTPPATCIDIPFEEMGKTAGKLLLDQIRNPGKTPVTQMLPGKLILRESTAPVLKNKTKEKK